MPVSPHWGLPYLPAFSVRASMATSTTESSSAFLVSLLVAYSWACLRASPEWALALAVSPLER